MSSFAQTKNTKVYILDTGYLETDKNNVVAGSSLGTRSNPHTTNQWIRLPVMAILICHSSGKNILYDLGSHPDAMTDHWPPHLQEIYPLYQSPEQRIENQLALCGLTPQDIDTVVLSHLHLDHAGTLHQFTHCDVYVPKADFTYAQTLVRLTMDPLTHGGYIKKDLDVSVKQFHLVEEDMDLVPGITLLQLPGHTPGLLGLMIHLEEEGTLLFPQDCVYSREIYGPPAKASGLLYDSLSFFQSIEKVRALENKYQAKVFFAHDDEFFQTIKKAPEYYS